MPSTIDALRAGHHSVDRLLEVLRRQLDAFEHGGTPDMALMHDIIEGLNRYVAAGADGHEGRLIDELTCEDGRFASARVVLTTEHHAITTLGAQCRGIVEGILDGVVVPRAALTAPIRRYMRLFRAHLQREGAYIDRVERSVTAEPRLAITADFPLHQRASADALADLLDRVRQAASRQRRDQSGVTACPACAIGS